MPVIQVRYNPQAIPAEVISSLRDSLPIVAAKAMASTEGITLEPKHIMIEIDESGALDVNCKDINVRVWSHDYPSRRSALDRIRTQIAHQVSSQIPQGATWYVWILLANSSYSSDSETMTSSVTSNIDCGQ